MELNLVNYIRIDLASPLEPPIVFKDKKAIYGYNISDGLLWIYDTENEGTLICGIALSSIKAVWFNEEPYVSAGVEDTVGRFEKVNFETDEKNLTEAEIIEKAKEFLDGIIEKEKMK